MRVPFQILAVVLVALSACDGKGASPTQPTPLAPPPTVPSPSANSTSVYFVAQQTVRSVKPSSRCGFYLQPGETADGYRWVLEYTGNSFDLYLEWGLSQPYKGTLEGLGFAASLLNPRPDYVGHPCDFRQSWISGSFTEDFTSFEAQETQIWGPPEDELRIELQWRASRV